MNNRVLGATLLIAGSCVGAGMLGLPILTGFVGFYPTLLLFAIACVYMTATGFILIDINHHFGMRANLITMVQRTLGPIASGACWVLFLFLFYSLLVAYISASGSQCVQVIHHYFGWALPTWVGEAFFVVLFGWIIYLGTYVVDMTNRILMLFKIVSFIFLIAIAFPYVQSTSLMYSNLKYVLFPLPILIISFGFQNMIPPLFQYLDGNVKAMKRSLVFGSCLALVMYVLWNIIALGSLPIEGANSITESFHLDKDAAWALSRITHKPLIAIAAQIMAFFAILTSFLGQSISLVHFLQDGFKIHKTKKENPGICLLTLIPPLIISLIYPQLFFQALNFAGGICAVLIYGVLPVSMSFVLLRKNSIRHSVSFLVILLLFSLLIFGYQLIRIL